LIEPNDEHCYQPAWTLVGGGAHDIRKTMRPMARVLPDGVTWVQAAVSLSYEAQLTNDSAAVLTDKDRRVIYVEGDNLMLRDIGETAALPAIQLNELPIRVSFTNVAAGVVKPSANMVYVTISTVDSSPVAYSLSSAIHLPNIAQSVTVAPATATPPYSAVAFRTAREGALDLSLGDMTGVGCFIATAAYGSYDQQDVQLLRRFRDGILLESEPGRWFVRTYYRLSPPIASAIAGRPALCLLVRVLLLPFVGMAVALLHPGFALAVLLPVVLLIGATRRKNKSI
ncbi:MAG: CFI-box-CTERM domain-containing protein, partial [Oscillospiraceae bacterium]